MAAFSPIYGATPIPMAPLDTSAVSSSAASTVSGAAATAAPPSVSSTTPVNAAAGSYSRNRPPAGLVDTPPAGHGVGHKKNQSRRRRPPPADGGDEEEEDAEDSWMALNRHVAQGTHTYEITSFSLDDVAINKSQWEWLARVLPTLDNLRELALTRMKLDDDKCTQLLSMAATSRFSYHQPGGAANCHSIAGNENIRLESLDFSSNDLTFKSANHIGKYMMLQMDTLTHISLKKNKFRDHGAQLLGVFLRKLVSKKRKALQHGAEGSKRPTSTSVLRSASSASRRSVTPSASGPQQTSNIGPVSFDFEDNGCSPKGIAELLMSAACADQLVDLHLSKNVVLGRQQPLPKGIPRHHASPPQKGRIKGVGGVSPQSARSGGPLGFGSQQTRSMNNTSPRVNRFSTPTSATRSKSKNAIDDSLVGGKRLFEYGTPGYNGIVTPSEDRFLRKWNASPGARHFLMHEIDSAEEVYFFDDNLGNEEHEDNRLVVSCQIPAQTFQLIHPHSVLTSINLSHCRLGTCDNESIALLLQSILTSCSLLEHLDMSNNGLNDVLCTTLFDICGANVLASKNIQSLDFSRNRLTDLGAKALACAIESFGVWNDTLTWLSLAHNQLSLAGCLAILAACTPYLSERDSEVNKRQKIFWRLCTEVQLHGNKGMIEGALVYGEEEEEDDDDEAASPCSIEEQLEALYLLASQLPSTCTCTFGDGNVRDQYFTQMSFVSDEDNEVLQLRAQELVSVFWLSHEREHAIRCRQDPHGYGFRHQEALREVLDAETRALQQEQSASLMKQTSGTTMREGAHVGTPLSSNNRRRVSPQFHDDDASPSMFRDNNNDDKNSNRDVYRDFSPMVDEGTCTALDGDGDNDYLASTSLSPEQLREAEALLKLHEEQRNIASPSSPPQHEERRALDELAEEEIILQGFIDTEEDSAAATAADLEQQEKERQQAEAEAEAAAATAEQERLRLEHEETERQKRMAEEEEERRTSDRLALETEESTERSTTATEELGDREALEHIFASETSAAKEAAAKKAADFLSPVGNRARAGSGRRASPHVRMKHYTFNVPHSSGHPLTHAWFLRLHPALHERLVNALTDDISEILSELGPVGSNPAPEEGEEDEATIRNVQVLLHPDGIVEVCMDTKERRSAISKTLQDASALYEKTTHFAQHVCGDALYALIEHYSSSEHEPTATDIDAGNDGHFAKYYSPVIRQTVVNQFNGDAANAIRVFYDNEAQLVPAIHTLLEDIAAQVVEVEAGVFSLNADTNGAGDTPNTNTSVDSKDPYGNSELLAASVSKTPVNNNSFFSPNDRAASVPPASMTLIIEHNDVPWTLPVASDFTSESLDGKCVNIPNHAESHSAFLQTALTETVKVNRGESIRPAHTADSTIESPKEDFTAPWMVNALHEVRHNSGAGFEMGVAPALTTATSEVLRSYQHQESQKQEEVPAVAAVAAHEDPGQDQDKNGEQPTDANENKVDSAPQSGTIWERAAAAGGSSKMTNDDIVAAALANANLSEVLEHPTSDGKEEDEDQVVAERQETLAPEAVNESELKEATDEGHAANSNEEDGEGHSPHVQERPVVAESELLQSVTPVLEVAAAEEEMQAAAEPEQTPAAADQSSSRKNRKTTKDMVSEPKIPADPMALRPISEELEHRKLQSKLKGSRAASPAVDAAARGIFCRSNSGDGSGQLPVSMISPEMREPAIANAVKTLLQLNKELDGELDDETARHVVVEENNHLKWMQHVCEDAIASNSFHTLPPEPEARAKVRITKECTWNSVDVTVSVEWDEFLLIKQKHGFGEKSLIHMHPLMSGVKMSRVNDREIILTLEQGAAQNKDAAQSVQKGANRYVQSLLSHHHIQVPLKCKSKANADEAMKTLLNEIDRCRLQQQQRIGRGIKALLRSKRETGHGENANPAARSERSSRSNRSGQQHQPGGSQSNRSASGGGGGRDSVSSLSTHHVAETGQPPLYTPPAAVAAAPEGRQHEESPVYDAVPIPPVHIASSDQPTTAADINDTGMGSQSRRPQAPLTRPVVSL